MRLLESENYWGVGLLESETIMRSETIITE